MGPLPDRLIRGHCFPAVASLAILGACLHAKSVIIVRSGSWIYAGEVAKPVDVVGLPYDFWYELARVDEQLEPGEMPLPLSDEGLLYYVRFRHAGETSEPTWPDSVGYDTITAATHSAETQVPSRITWT